MNSIHYIYPLIRCQNQVKSKSQPIVSVSPGSSPPRPTSASNPSSSRPTSASNPSSSKSRLLNNNSPVLPSYPVIPSSHSRPPSSGDIHRPMPVVEPIQSNEPLMSKPRVRRRLQPRRSNPLPMNNEEKNLEYLSKLSQNDTLQRFRRDQRLNNDLKQQQQRSSSDEQDASPIRPSNENISQPIIVIIYLIQNNFSFFFHFVRLLNQYIDK